MDTLTVKVWNLDWPSASMRLVALAIARRSRETGATWAKQKTLADDTDLSAKTVQRLMADMEAMEPPRLKRVERRRADGSRSSDMIWLTLPEVVLKADVVSASEIRRAKMEAREQGDTMADQGDVESSWQRTPCPGGPPMESEQKDSLKGSIEGKNARTRELSDSEAIEGIDVALAVESIWRAVGDLGRKRSAKAKVEKALLAALRRRPRAVTAEEHLRRVMMGVRAYLEHPDTRKEKGKFEHGAHRTLQDDVWESFLDDRPRSAGEARDLVDPAVGNAQEPGPKLQAYWMDTWAQGLPWPSERGPRPGMLGCRVSPDLLAQHGVTPLVQAEDVDDGAAFD